MKELTEENDVLQWHPAFFAGLQIELEEDRENLIFENEHQLSKKPMEIDVLVIKKEKALPVKKNIGRIFRKYNIVEYKSPTDYLSIDDFYKVYGYACFYKSDTGATDAVQAEELTITLVSSGFPTKLIGHLRKNRGYTVDKEENGIYYVNGDYIPVQIVVTSQLSEKENLWLKSLTNQINGGVNAEKLLDAYGKHKNDNLYKAVMNVIVRANKETFQEVKAMCEALKELMKDELDAAMQAGIEKGMQTGIQKGMETGVKIVIENCREFHLSREQTEDKIALKYELSSEKAEEYMQKFW